MLNNKLINTNKEVVSMIINEKAFKKIKKAIINIDGKDYIKVKKDTFKRLGYRYNIFTKEWKRTKLNSIIFYLKFKAIKFDKNSYLVGVDLDALNQPLADMFVAPYVAELIEVGD